MKFSNLLPPEPEVVDSAQVTKIAVLFTDIVGSTQYFKSRGDRAGRRMLEIHQQVASAPITAHGGIVVKTIGDSVMAYFLDPVDALKAAIAIQQDSNAYNEKLKPEDQIHVRIALHFGEGIVEEHDIFGNVVNLAAKLVAATGADELFISEELYELVKNVPLIDYQEIALRNKTRGLKALKVICDNSVCFEPASKMLLYLRPLWNLNKHGFSEAWRELIKNRKRRMWEGKAEKETVFPDDSVALIISDFKTAFCLVEDIMMFLSNKLSQSNNFIPVQILIDSGPYLQAGEMAVDKLQVGWGEIDPGDIYISDAALKNIEDKQFFSNNYIIDGGKVHNFHKIVKHETKLEKGDDLFLYQDMLVQGDKPECFYCGDRRHRASECPSKQILETTTALNDLGHVSTETVNKIFFNYLAGRSAARGDEKGKNRQNYFAYHAFYELKMVFQLRYFMTLWDSSSEKWGIGNYKNNYFDKGGAIWLGLDCIRVSNLSKAESFLKAAIDKEPHNYKPYCAMGFLYVEKNDYGQAQQYFSKAYERARTKPQKLYTLFLLAHIYKLSGDFSQAEQKIREIINADPRCMEAAYEGVKFKFEKGFNNAARTELRKVIQSSGESYVKALIDPDLAPYKDSVYPELKDIMEQTKEEACQIIPKAEGMLAEFKKSFGEEDKEVQEAKSWYTKIISSMKSDGYLGYVEVIYYANMIIVTAGKLIEGRKRDIEEHIYYLERQCNTYTKRINNYQSKILVSKIQGRINEIRKEIIDVRDVFAKGAFDDLQAVYRKIKEISAKFDEIKDKLEKIDNIIKLYRFLTYFFKKSFFIQGFNIFVSIVLLPIIVHYLVFLLPNVQIPHQSLWAYQKGLLVFGGMGGVIAATFLAIKKLYGEQ